jgi:hypothetical protein
MELLLSASVSVKTLIVEPPKTTLKCLAKFGIENAEEDLDV